MKISKITPILVVQAIEPCLHLWSESLGYKKATEVPHEGKLGFVILQKDGAELMLQTRSSVQADVPAVAEALREGASILYMEVDSVDRALAAVTAVPGNRVLVPIRRTFYGAREFFAQDAQGQILGFAQFE